MKKRIFNVASYLTVLVLAVVTMFNVSSCSKDDDSEGNPFSVKALVGEWKRSYKIDNYNNGVESYYFDKDGTGRYENTYGTKAYFDYKVKGKGIINYDIVWWYKDGGYKKEKYYWSFWIKADTLHLDNKTYTRQ